jgi:hypothetical protein
MTFFDSLEHVSDHLPPVEIAFSAQWMKPNGITRIKVSTMQVIHDPSGAGGRSHVFAIHFHSPANEGIPAEVTVKTVPIPNRSKRAQGTAGASVTSKCFAFLLSSRPLA